ncbi:recombinase family protein [Pontibacter toksunensis]|uniref:Recombinase family protein n=1 Tax=Pontibacter toksunensis TaxID=1332631 RepID=A0ABW6BWZ0_9BACT
MSKTTHTPVAIFVRVSKGSQDYTRQVEDLTIYSKEKGYAIVEVIAEKISGAKKNAQRQAIKQLLVLAEGGTIQKVLVTEISRLGRNTLEGLKVLDRLRQLGVSVFLLNRNIESITPEGKSDPIAKLFFTIMLEFAEWERETIIERIHSGLEEARRKGKTLGRKKGTTKTNAQLLEEHSLVVRHLKAGHSIRHVAAICGVGTATVQRVKKAVQQLKE